MSNFFKTAFAGLCLFILSGCCCGGGYYDAYRRGPCVQRGPIRCAPVNPRLACAPTKNICNNTCAAPYRCQPLPKSYKRVTLYMEQWDALAQYIANEVFCGLGEKRTINVASSGITSFKKGFREFLITALTRRGLTVVDSDVDIPVLEFDLLPFSERNQGNFFLGRRGNFPTQIMVNMSILDRGQYIYRNSTVHTVPRGEIYDYIEDERLEQAPFKTYQLVAS